MLTKEAVQYSLQFLEDHPQLVRFYKLVWGADEFIFSTILYNSEFHDKIRDNLTYVDWSGEKTGHPKILGAEDFEKLKNSEKLFARKMDMDKDPRIFALLEEWLQPERMMS